MVEYIGPQINVSMCSRQRDELRYDDCPGNSSKQTEVETCVVSHQEKQQGARKRKTFTVFVANEKTQKTPKQNFLLSLEYFSPEADLPRRDWQLAIYLRSHE